MSTRQTYFGKTSLIEEAKKKLGLVIKDNAITTNKIKDSAVTNEKLADDAVTGRNIKEGSININQLSDKCISDIQTSSMGEEAIKSFINDELSKKQGEIIEVNVRKTDDNGDLVEDDLDNPKITSFDFNTIYEKFKAGQPIIILYKYSKPVYESPREEATEVLTVYNMDNRSTIIYGHHSSSPGWYRTILASNDTRNILLTSITELSDSDIWRMLMTEKESNKNELTFSYIKNL